MLMAWGQFLDHDIVQTPLTDFISAKTCRDLGCASSADCFPITINSAKDSDFAGRKCLPFTRSGAACGTGASRETPR